MILHYSIIFLICVFSGILTGLLGVGGGLIIVPIFITVLPLFGITDISTHQIIGISTTCVLFNSASASFYRRKEKHIDKKLLTILSFFIILGTVLGSFWSSQTQDKIIFLIYIIVCIISIYLMNKDIFFNLYKSKLKFVLYLIFSLIGGLSATIGIGGAVFFATAIKCFIKADVKELLPSITFLVLIHASFAFLSKLLLGEVIIHFIPLIIIASLIGSKIGIKISKCLSAKLISILMQGILILGIIKISLKYIS